MVTALGTNVRVFREKAGLSQRALAAKIGCASSMIAHLERGEIARTSFLGAIARALNVPAEVLEGHRSIADLLPPVKVWTLSIDNGGFGHQPPMRAYRTEQAALDAQRLLNEATGTFTTITELDVE